jgi:hypothetical protein
MFNECWLWHTFGFLLVSGTLKSTKKAFHYYYQHLHFCFPINNKYQEQIFKNSSNCTNIAVRQNWNAGWEAVHSCKAQRKTPGKAEWYKQEPIMWI